MPVFDRPQLRRRSQSEQVVPTKAALAMTTASSVPKGVDTTIEQPKAHTPATPHSSRIDSGSFKMNTPLTPGQSTLASIIERKKATLPPKPDAAVLAAAAKKAKKHVFFSTPTPPMRYSPIMAQERAPYQFGSCSATKMLSGESHLPPPPYTPVGLAANMPYPGPYPRPFDYACTPACTVTKHVHTPPQFGVPPPPASTSSVTTIFPSVIAASEALRINLGLENKTVDVAYNASYQAGPPINMSLQQRSPSVPGIPLPPVQVQFPAGYHGTSPKKAALMQTVQQKLMSSLDPQPGQTQPLGSMSPNLPPVINTGHKGPMKIQPGDWGCLVCSFINWRRRKYCMRCCPFAEGNNNLSASMLATMAVAQNPYYASMPGALRPVYPVYATPPRQVGPRGHPLLGPLSMPLAPIVPMPMGAPMPMHAGPLSMSGPLQSPFGPMLPPPHELHYRQPGNMASLPPLGIPETTQAELDAASFLYDSGYARSSTATAQEPSALPQQHHQQAKITEIDRPVTPSPTGSQSSGCSFAFSNSPPSDADSPTTSINSSNGSTSSASSPDTACKTLNTPPSSHFRDFQLATAAKETPMPVRVEGTTMSIEHHLEQLRL